MNTEVDFMGYSVIADGDDVGRYATADVAISAYADSLYSYISDASKDARGFRVRMDISSFTLCQLESECDYWEIQVRESVEEDERISSIAVEEFRQLVLRTIELGAKDEATALRWLTQDREFFSFQDVEHYVWEYGILFTDYGRLLVEKLKSIVQYAEIPAARN